MIDWIAKGVDVVSNSIEKLSETPVEVRQRVEKLDMPLNIDRTEELVSGEELSNSIDDLDHALNDEILEYDENGYRKLTDEEMQELRENQDWPDKPEGIQGCKINEDGVIKYPCRNESLEGKINPLTGVRYEKKIVEIYGYRVEGVVPVFESVFETKLPESLIKAKDKVQFAECNVQLYEAIQKNSDLTKRFTPEQLEQIKEGMTRGGAPDGYTWHHDAEVGKMQLVDSDIHGDSRHTGGKTLWGGGNDYR